MDSASSFRPGIKIQGGGAKSIFMEISSVFKNQVSGGGEEGAKVYEGAALWKKGRLETVLCDYQIV